MYMYVLYTSFPLSAFEMLSGMIYCHIKESHSAGTKIDSHTIKACSVLKMKH